MATKKKYTLLLSVCVVSTASMVYYSHVKDPFTFSLGELFATYHSLQRGGFQPSEGPNFVPFRDTFDPSKVPHATFGPDDTTNKGKYFIYRCDQDAMKICGGWADRMKGAMHAYMVANLTGRSFKMEMLIHSCDIHRFIVPNQVNWSLPHSFHETVRRASDVSKLDMVDHLHFIKSLNHNFLSFPQMRSKYVYFKVNRNPIQYWKQLTNYQSQLGWMKDVENADIFNTIYRRLFKPSTYMLNKVKSFLNDNLQPSSKLVCVHLRMGHNPSIKDVGPNIYTRPKDLPVAWNFLYNETKESNVKIFVMSDSQGAIDTAKHLNFSDKIFFSSGKIVHVDHVQGVSREEVCEGYENVIFEQLVLMHCDVLVLTRNSGISIVASLIRGTDENLYCIFSTGEFIPCKRADLI